MQVHLLFRITLVLFGLSFLILNGCGSTKSEILYKDPDFSGKTLLNSSITIFPPKDILITNNKYSDYSPSEVRDEITTRLKKAIEKESISANIFLEKEAAPSSLKSISFKNDDLKKFLKTIKTNYIISIQQLLVGEDSKTQSMSNPTGGSTYFKQEIVKVTVYFEVWKTDQTSSVFSVQVNSDVSGGGIIHTLYPSIDNAISEFVDLLSK